MPQSKRRLLARMAAAVPFVFTGVVAVPTAAHASCPTDYYYYIPSHSGYFMWDGRTSFKDGPGGTMSGTVTTATTVSTTVSASGSYSVNGIIEEAKIEISASLTASVTTTVGHTYSHNITAGKYGNMRYGSWGEHVNWEYWRDNSTCTSTRLGYGTANIANTAVGWKYWETSS